MNIFNKKYVPLILSLIFLLIPVFEVNAENGEQNISTENEEITTNAPVSGDAQTFFVFPGEEEALQSKDFRVYVKNFYQFAIPAAILVATVLIMIGGIIWVTSAGNQSRVGKAQEYIVNSVIGVVLLMSSYLILRVINPNLVELQPLTSTLTQLEATGACYQITNDSVEEIDCHITTEKECGFKNWSNGISCSEIRADRRKKIDQAAHESKQKIKETLTNGPLTDQDLTNLKQLINTVAAQKIQYHQLACTPEIDSDNNYGYVWQQKNELTSIDPIVPYYAIADIEEHLGWRGESQLDITYPASLGSQLCKNKCTNLFKQNCNLQAAYYGDYLQDFKDWHGLKFYEDILINNTQYSGILAKIVHFLDVDVYLDANWGLCVCQENYAQISEFRNYCFADFTISNSTSCVNSQCVSNNPNCKLDGNSTPNFLIKEYDIPGTNLKQCVCVPDWFDI